jgi:transposase
MRKSFDGLSGLVNNELGRNPASGDVFIFLNRSRTFIKLLHWERGGYVLYYKRLEKGTFTVPDIENTQVKWTELVLMIEGIEVKKSIQKARYKE